MGIARSLFRRRKNATIPQAAGSAYRAIVEPLEVRSMLSSTLLTGTAFGLMPNQTDR